MQVYKVEVLKAGIREKKWFENLSQSLVSVQRGAKNKLLLKQRELPRSARLIGRRVKKNKLQVPPTGTSDAGCFLPPPPTLYSGSSLACHPLPPLSASLLSACHDALSS